MLPVVRHNLTRKHILSVSQFDRKIVREIFCIGSNDLRHIYLLLFLTTPQQSTFNSTAPRAS